MASITTRAATGTGATAKGSPLTNAELDANFIALNGEIYVDAMPTVEPSLMLDFVNTSELDSRVTFTRASTGTYFGPDGLLKTAGVNVPRFEYDPVTLAPRGLLVEESRTNLFLNSAQFDAAAWNKGTGSISANTVVAPDGTLSADSYTWAASTGSFAFLDQTVAGNATNTHTYSIWLKRPAGSGSRNVRLVLSDYSLSTAFSAEVTVTENWQRFAYSRASVNNTGFVGAGLSLAPSNSIAAGEVLDVWGAQLEAGSFATSYIPTAGSQVTRAAETPNVNNLAPWFSNAEGTIHLDVGAAQGPYPQVFELRLDGNNYLKVGKEMAASLTSTQYELLSLFGNNQQLGIAPGVSTGQVAFAYKQNDSAVSGNGGAVAVDTSCQFPVWTSMHIGWSLANGGRQANTHIRRIAYYPVRLSNAQLQALTAP